MGLQHWLGGDSDEPATSPDTSIVGNGQPTLVELGMNTCASCRSMHRVLDELRAAHGERLRIIPVNVMEQAELTSKWKARAIPTQVLLAASSLDRVQRWLDTPGKGGGFAYGRSICGALLLVGAGILIVDA
jgi:thiol-disulfide isomerase/thioredoxin